MTDTVDRDKDIENRINKLKWTKDIPTEPGWYWVWQPKDKWPCRGEVLIVEIVYEFHDLCALIPRRDYTEPLLDEDGLPYALENAMFIGPLTIPKTPHD